MKCAYLDNPEAHILHYEVYSFAKITGRSLEIGYNFDEDIITIARQIWPDKKHLFGGMAYEYIILGIALYLAKEEEQDILFDITSYIENTFKGDAEKHIQKTYSVYLSLRDILGTKSSHLT